MSYFSDSDGLMRDILLQNECPRSGLLEMRVMVAGLWDGAQTAKLAHIF